LYRDWHYLNRDWNELPLDPRHIGIPSSVSKMISEPMVCISQSVHLFYTKINNISKWNERASAWPTSPRSSTRCTQNGFWAYCMFSANRAPILRLD
jgi:hypothetical protein